MERAFLENLLGEDAQAIDAILGEHQKALDDMAFQGMMSAAIRDAGARSEKAVAALLDTATIRESDDPKKAAAQALQQLRQAESYLFDLPAPRYAAGTGAGDLQPKEPGSLADALKQKFGK